VRDLPDTARAVDDEKKPVDGAGVALAPYTIVDGNRYTNM
jgi:hypothetical protein